MGGCSSWPEWHLTPEQCLKSNFLWLVVALAFADQTSQETYYEVEICAQEFYEEVFSRNSTSKGSREAGLSSRKSSTVRSCNRGSSQPLRELQSWTGPSELPQIEARGLVCVLPCE